MSSDEDNLDNIDFDFIEIFEILSPNEIIKLLNATGGKFTPEEGKIIKKLVDFVTNLGDDQIDNFLDAFDEIMEGK